MGIGEGNNDDMMRFPGAWIIALTAATVGCGPRMATVSGVVTFNGEAVPKGSITFLPVDGKGSAFGGPIVAGRYSVSGVSPGAKIVQLSSPVEAETTKDDYGNESRVFVDLFPVEWGLKSKETLAVVAPTTSADYAIEGSDPRRR